MPKKNPDWKRDEVILALALYFNPHLGPITVKNPKIIELSKLLNQLPLFGNSRDKTTFRNPNGIVLNLANFKALDPNYKGKGMRSYSKLAEEIFNEFRLDLPRLNHIANEIKAIASNPVLLDEITIVGDDEVTDADCVTEGQVLYKLHKVRERNRKIVQQKKASIFKEKGKLECEACQFNFRSVYGKLGEWYIECHHLIPLATLQERKKTRLKDLALLCSNCHRMIHKDLTCLSIFEFRQKWNS